MAPSPRKSLETGMPTKGLETGMPDHGLETAGRGFRPWPPYTASISSEMYS